jgi:hypothetical protein
LMCACNTERVPDRRVWWIISNNLGVAVTLEEKEGE